MAQHLVDLSVLEQLAQMPVKKRRVVLGGLGKGELEQLLAWPARARPQQLPPEGDWFGWLIMAGRAWGKTRTGAEHCNWRVATGRSHRLALIARSPADVRDTMIEGESGIIACAPNSLRPIYESTKRRLVWPNGAFALCFSSYEPDLLRGVQFDFAWCDELASWHQPREAWDNLMLALRLGDKPQVIITTTPRPIGLMRELAMDERFVHVRGSTYDNKANLSQTFYTEVVARYEGTSSGRQELYGDVLEDAEGALWKRAWVDDTRVWTTPDLLRTVVAIDPAATSNETADETGIIAAAIGKDKHWYVLRDISGRYTPRGWAEAAIGLAGQLKADRIIGETNNGGEMVEYTLRTVRANVPYKAVHASQGKRARAEPVASLYERGLVHHVGGFPELEDQLCNWQPLTGDRSPDRLDALVWALTELQGSTGRIGFYG